MEALEALNSRRGIFHFKNDPVEPAKLAQVLEAAANAPTPANLQPWAFVVVTDLELKSQVASYLVRTQAECVFGTLLGMSDEIVARETEAYRDLPAAPCFVVMCLEPKVKFALPEHDDALHAWYVMSVGAALANLMTGATALGLGTRLIGGFGLENRGQGLKDLLGIPRDVEVIAVTPLGYPAEREQRPPAQSPADLSTFQRGDPSTLAALFRGRLPLSRLVHSDRW